MAALPEHKLSNNLELSPQEKDTHHRAVLPAGKTDNIGKQKLKSLEAS